MNIIDGWLDSAIKKQSPNFNSRPPGCCIDLLVIHNISLPPKAYGGPYIEDFFLNKLDSTVHPYFQEIADMEVSSHFLIKRTGDIVQFVSCNERAWHAGNSSFCGRSNCNDFSIGVELEGSDDTPYENVQYSQLVALTKAVQASYPSVSSGRITGHSDIAPDRKTDPGPAFDWSLYLDRLA